MYYYLNPYAPHWNHTRLCPHAVAWLGLFLTAECWSEQQGEQLSERDLGSQFPGYNHWCIEIWASNKDIINKM